MVSDPKRDLLRHAVATVAYRGGKAVRNASAEVADFQAGATTRTPIQILAHVGDLFDWALSMAEGKQKWQNSKPLPWKQEVGRFFAALKAFDNFLASEKPLGAPVEKLLQGPVADALTHVGQIVMLRRLAGAPMKSENYFLAEISTGRVEREQTEPVIEFD